MMVIFEGQSGGVCRHTDGDNRPSLQVLGSSGPHGSLRLLKKPTEGRELLHGSQSPHPPEDSVEGHRGHSEGPCCCWDMPAGTPPAAPPPQSLCPKVLTICGRSLSSQKRDRLWKSTKLTKFTHLVCLLHGPARGEHRGNLKVFTHITPWEIDGEQWKQCQTLLFLDSKITADGDCSHEIKRCLLLGRKVMTNLHTY